MDQIEQHITLLTKIWMDIVCQDHHKDRDCHWYIQKDWSYGDPPTYQGQHNGYIYRDWFGPDRETYKEAREDLINELRKAFNDQIKWAQSFKDEEDENLTAQAEFILSRKNQIDDIFKAIYYVE